MTVIERMDELETRFFESLTTIQGQAVEANAQAAERVGEFRTSAAAPVDALPTPAQLMSRYYDFAAKMLDTNRKFAEQMIGPWSDGAKTAAPKASTSKAGAKSSK